MQYKLTARGEAEKLKIKYVYLYAPLGHAIIGAGEVTTDSSQAQVNGTR